MTQRSVAVRGLVGLVPCPRAQAENAWRASLAAVSVADLAASVDADNGGKAMSGLRAWLGGPDED